MEDKKDKKIKKPISKKKKLVWAISTAMVLAAMSFVVIKVFAATPLPTSYENDANYYYYKGGRFAWYGTSTKTEYGSSWSTAPKAPGTLYSKNMNDNQFAGHHENNGLGFVAYSQKWDAGNAAKPIPAGNVGKYNFFKRVTVNYRRAKTSPTHKSISITGAPHVKGNDYWIKPNTKVDVKMHGYQTYAGGVQQLDDFIRYNYLRVNGTGIDMGRARMAYNGAYYLSLASNDVTFAKGATSRTDGNRNLYSTVAVTPKKTNSDYTLEVNHTSMNGKQRPYALDAKKIRTDGDAPVFNSGTITGHTYKSGSNYWVKPNDSVKVTVKQTDARSGNRFQYLRLNEGSKEAVVRSRHDFAGATNVNVKQATDAGAEITAASRTGTGTAQTVAWTVKPKTNGKNYTVQAFLQDNVNNQNDYTTIGNIRVDNEAPTVTFSPNGISSYSQSHSTKVTVSDTGSGVKTREYAWMTSSTTNPTKWTSFADGATFTTPNSTASHFLWIRTTDNVGNTTITTSKPFVVDKKAPFVSLSVDGNSTYKDKHTTKITAYDNESGIKSLQYAWSTSNTTTPSSWNTFVSGATQTTPSATGNHYLWVKATDVAGNVTSMTSKAFKVDATLPTVSASPTSGAWKNTAHTVTPTYGDAHSGVNLKQYTWSTSTATPTSWSNYTSGALKQPGVGSYYLHLRVTDKAGNSKTSRVGPYRYETTKPTATITQSPSTWTNGDITLNIKASDSGGSGFYRTKLPDGKFTTSANASYPVTTNGAYSFTVYDNAGNSQVYSTDVKHIDKAAPTHVSNSIQGERYKNGDNYWVRPKDKLSVTFRQRDEVSGNKQGYIRLLGNSQDVRYFNDFDSSKTDMKAVNSSYVNTSTLSVTGVERTEHNTSTGYGTLKWEVQPNVHGHNYAIQYYHRDKANNNRGYTTVGRLRVDGVGPNITLSKNSGAYAKSHSVKLTATDSDSGLAKLEYQWTTTSGFPSSGTFKTASSGTTMSTPSSTVAKDHYLHVRATDNVGNVSTHSSGAFKVDQSNPTVTYGTNGVSTYGKSHSTKVTVSDTGSGVNTTQYAWSTSNTVQPSSWTNFTNGATLSTPSSSGIHYLWVKATDKVGNQIITKSLGFRVDVTPPTSLITQTPTEWTKGSVTLNISGIVDVGGSQYYRTKLPNGTYSTSKTPSQTVTENGKYSFVIYDNAGNSTTKTINVTNIDKVAPTGSTSQTPTAWTNKNVAITVNGSDTGSGVKSITMKNSSDLKGRNFIVNSELESKTVSLTWDESLNGKLAPKRGWSQGQNTGTANTTVGYHAHLNESKFGYPVLEYINKNNQFGMKNRWLGFSQSFTATGDLGKELKVGQKLTISFDVRSDKVGGTIDGGMYRYHKSTGDRAFPNRKAVKTTKANTWERVSFEQTVDANWDLTKTFTIYLYGNREDNEATKWVKNIKLELGDEPTEFSVNPDDISMVGTKSVFDISENGKYDFLITDNVGNTTTKTHNVTNIDKVPPTGKFEYSTTGTTNKNVTVKLTGSDSESGVKSIQLPDGTIVNGKVGSYTVSTNGSYDFVVTDVAGNQTKLTAKVDNIDKTPPTLTLTASTKDWTNDGVTIKATATDAGGIKNIILPNGVSVNASTASQKVSVNDTYTFQAFDKAGNKTTKSITITNIDKDAPKASITKTSETNTQVNLKLEYSD